MIDAAGAIYVIGGLGGGGTAYDTEYQDVWASTDGGAGRTQSGWSKGCVGVLGKYSEWGTRGVYLHTTWAIHVYSRGSRGVLERYKGVLGGTVGVLRGVCGYPAGT